MIAAVLLVALFSGAFELSARDLPMQSVRALQMPVLDPHTLAVSIENICTASSVGDGEWLTKAHCVTHGRQVYISGEPAAVIKADDNVDLALVKTRFVKAPALRVAVKAPSALDVVVMLGHPMGFYQVVATTGWVSVPEWREPGMAFPLMLVQIVGAPGNSGSSILNTRGEIISVLEGGWGRSFEPMAVGSAHSVLVAILKK